MGQHTVCYPKQDFFFFTLDDTSVLSQGIGMTHCVSSQKHALGQYTVYHPN